MNNKVKTEQVALLLALTIPGGKFLTLPALMAKGAGRDYWISMIILFVFDLICLAFVLWALNINKQGKSINDILTQSLGKVITKIIFAVLFVFILLRAMTLLESCLELLSATFTIKTNWIAYILPISALMIFIIYRGFNNIARLSEMLFVIIFLALLAILFFASDRADFGNLKPILDDGIKPVFKTAVNGSFWFADYLFILFVMDEFKPNKKFFGSIGLGFLAGAFVTVFVNVLYVALFDQLTVLSDSIISKISQFSLKATSSGRLDWLSLIIWLFSLFIKAASQFFCANKCLTYIFGVGESKFHFYTAIICIAPVIIAPLVYPIKDVVYTAAARDGLGFVFWGIEYLLPLLLPLLTWICYKKDAKRTLYPRRT